MNRTVTVFEHGAVAVTQRTIVTDRTVATEVSGPACIYAEVQVLRGRVVFLRDDQQVETPQYFRLFLPPFAITQASLSACKVDSWGLAFSVPSEVSLPAEAVIVSFTEAMRARQPEDVVDWTRSLGPAAEVGRRSQNTELAAWVKQTLDDEYRDGVRIAAIAQRVRSSAASVSRIFLRAYGVTPVQYRHQLRVIDAMTRLAAGQAPIDVCHGVGFNDLSRFYKVFRRFACDSPGGYRRPKNAKTRS